MKRIMNKKNFLASSAWRLGGAARRAATALLLCVMTCATAWASVPQGYDYIDASGTTHNTAMDGIGENDNPTVINSTNKPTTLSGWYVVSGNVNYTETVTLSDNTTIILADGAHLSIGTSSNRISSGNCIYADGKSLTIYGQTNQTGTLSVYNRLRNNAVYVAGYTQHGGTVTIDGTDQTALFLDDGDLTLTRGTLIVNASYNYHWNSIALSNGHVTVSGGTLSANSYINADDVTVSGGTLTTTGAIICNATLGLTNANDYIKAGEYWKTVKIADDQTLYDEAGNAYSGTLNSDEKAAIAGQMLTKAPNAVPTFLITYDLDGGQLPSGQTNPTSYTAESETFTLVNPVRNGYDFAGWTGTGLSSPTQTVTITQGETGIRSYRATWNEASNDISVSSDGNTYTILNDEGWGMFCDLLAAADGKTFFSGKTVKLGADISVTQSAGSEGHEFMGTFDGDGKTLTVNITDTGEQGTAPFRIISNATIRNLHVTGSVTGTTHAAGLVGKASAGTILIENCLVETNVNSTVGNNRHCGGIVGHGFGGSNPVNLTLRNCVYAGTITCDKNYIGGLQGWSDGNTLTLENCLFAGNYAGKDGNTALFHPIALHNTGKTTNLTATNVFAAVAPTATNANFIAADGTKTTGRATAPAGLGNQVATYNYMDMTVYENGLLYNGLYYVAPTLSTDTDNAYLIHNEDDWTNFCDALYDNGTWNRFTGKTVKLANDISVSRMAGYDNHDFLGTFDGNHKTLTFTATATANYLAPFRNVLGNSDTDRAVIRDLNVNTNITAHDHRHTAGLIALVWGYVDVTNCNVTVDITATKGATNTDLYPAGIASQVVKDAQIAVSGCTVGGTISTDGKYAGGIIGIAQGSASITDCLSSVTINSSTDGDGTHGGLVAVQGNYDGKTITIEGCVFKGKLLGASTHSCGGFVGWRSQTVTISNSLFVPVQVTINTVDGNTPCATFVRNGDSSTTITDCYYTTDFNDGVHFIGQGKQARSITAGENVTVENAGTATTYSTSGITSYGTGILYGDVLYAGNGDEVSLTLGCTAPSGYYCTGYTATAGILNGTTLTMPNGNVTINATLTPTISYIDENGETQQCTNYTLLTGTETTLGTGWYVADGTLNYGQTITLSGDVHLILKDNAVMNVGTEETPIPGHGIHVDRYSFSIYAQSTGESQGQLHVIAGADPFSDSDYNGIYAEGSSITINGGKVTVNGINYSDIYIDNGSVTINGGQVYADDIYSNNEASVTINGGQVTAGNIDAPSGVTINGGQVTAKYGGISAINGNIKLGWTNPTDFIHANSYLVNGGTLSIAEGKAFINAEGDIYESGTVNASDINGKTLRPYSNSMLFLADDADNTAIISKFNSQPYNVTLAGRKLWKDGAWNTLCLPFDVVVGSGQMAGATAMTMNAAQSGFDSASGLLTLSFDGVGEGSTIAAGTPFIVKWTGNAGQFVENPMFSGVTISGTAAGSISFDGGSFRGTYNVMTFDAADPNVVRLEEGSNTLKYAASGDYLGACRAYFVVDPTAAGEGQTGARPTDYILHLGSLGLLEGSFNQRGDANGDGSISVTDIAVVVNCILQLTNNGGFSKYGADANGDGDITVTDIGVIVDLILGTSGNAASRRLTHDAPEPQ